MCGPGYEPILYNAVRMAAITDERCIRNIAIGSIWHSTQVHYWRLMVELARLMITAGTRIHERYGYATVVK